MLCMRKEREFVSRVFERIKPNKRGFSLLQQYSRLLKDTNSTVLFDPHHTTSLTELIIGNACVSSVPDRPLHVMARGAWEKQK